MTPSCQATRRRGGLGILPLSGGGGLGAMFVGQLEAEEGQMDMKRIAIGTIVGFVVFEVITYFVFDVLFGDYYAANAAMSGVLKTPNVQWAIAVTNFAGALLVTLGLEAKGGSASIASG